MAKCNKCLCEKPETDFYERKDTRKGIRSSCKECCVKYASTPVRKSRVADWRRNTKKRLVEYHGGKCLDCGYTGPPYQFQFDHRIPEEKSFQVSKYNLGYDALLEESLKCDLVCSICHAERTHRQRCKGCEYCL